MRVMAIDPGPSTGIALWDTDDELPWATTLQRHEAEDFIVEKIAKQAVHLVICEEFVITAGTAKKGRMGSESIEMIGVVKYFCRECDVELKFGRPSDAMKFATNEKLKRIGWYQTGPEHARDALRHLLTWAALNRKVDVKKLLPSD